MISLESQYLKHRNAQLNADALDTDCILIHISSLIVRSSSPIYEYEKIIKCLRSLFTVQVIIIVFGAKHSNALTVRFDGSVIGIQFKSHQSKLKLHNNSRTERAGGGRPQTGKKSSQRTLCIQVRITDDGF